MAIDTLNNLLASTVKAADHPDNHFDALVQALKDALGASSGLDSADIDVEKLKSFMHEYDSSEPEWKRYSMENARLPYTRNLVDEGNGKSNLLVLVWTPGKGSPIHDHGNAHCIMKILKGTLTEIRYAFPDADREEPMHETYRRNHDENDVAYMADELGVHQVCNMGSDFAVSLHLYTPPNVAKGGCNTFNKQTGKRVHVSKCGYWSAYGHRLPQD